MRHNCEFEDSLDFILNLKPGKTTQRDPISDTNKGEGM